MNMIEKLSIIISLLTALVAVWNSWFTIKSFNETRKYDVKKMRYEKLYDYYMEYISRKEKLNYLSPTDTINTLNYIFSVYENIKFLMDKETSDKLNILQNNLEKERNQFLSDFDIMNSDERNRSLGELIQASKSFNGEFKKYYQLQLSKDYNKLV